MRAAVIDCGTNTIRLLVADAAPDGGLAQVSRAQELVRLGQGVDATGEFHPDALARTFAAVDQFAAEIRRLGAQRLRFLATSAARDVRNRQDLLDGVRERLGVEVEVISGDAEARLSFLGALSGGPVAAGPVLVVDIGGGSTELIRGTLDGRVQQARSLDIGSVRLRERYLRNDPPLPSEVGQARWLVSELLDGCPVELAGAQTWIGVAGTATSLSAIHQGLTTDYDRVRVHDSKVPGAQVARLAERLLAMPVAEVQRRWPMLQQLRAEVICAGALICAEVARRAGLEMTVRETDILDGATLDLLRS